MHPGEVLVARLSGGVTLARFKEDLGSKIKLALGRNKEARVPAERVLIATGFVPENQDRFEEFQLRARSFLPEIDLAEVWDVITDDAEPVTLQHLSELYWCKEAESARLIALAFHLERHTDYFTVIGNTYLPRSRDELRELMNHREREIRNAKEGDSLIEALANGSLPKVLTEYQEQVLMHLKNLAIYGDDYSSSSAAIAFLQGIENRTRDFQRLAFDILVGVGIFSPDEPLELLRADIRDSYPEAIMKDMEEIDLEFKMSIASRTSMTDLESFTVDDDSTEDRDDALGIESLDTGLRVLIHIADAGALVMSGSPIDIEASKRMTTLYLPERKIEMLPPSFTKKFGSLDPGHERPAMSLLVDLDNNGRIISSKILASIVRTRAALSYEEANRTMFDPDSGWNKPLEKLVWLANMRRKIRGKSGAVNIDQPEMAIKVDSQGQVSVRVVERASPARAMVAEFMILCNSILAEFCRDRGIPAAYRSQPSPDTSNSGGLDVDESDPGQMALQRSLLGKLMHPASISSIPEPHGGLGVDVYIQASSPLRRYPDLVMQRQISHYLEHGVPMYSTEEIDSLAWRADTQMRELAKIEGQRKRYWFIKYLLQQRLEQAPSFNAYVLENESRRSAMLELDEFPFRTRVDLPENVKPGHTVKVSLRSIDTWESRANFEYISTM